MGFFEVIVIGGGHAGTEAAWASSRMGRKTLLVTHNIDTIGHMACNPSIGGVGRSQLVKDVDALGGLMPRCMDKSGINFRRLNTSKGEAVHSTRGQADRTLYKMAIVEALSQEVNLSILQQNVASLLCSQGAIAGIKTTDGLEIFGKTVVITAGTFLTSRMHLGQSVLMGGRSGESFKDDLSKELIDLCGQQINFKTGTPMRVDGKTIDFSRMQPLYSSDPMPYFSFFSKGDEHPEQRPSYVVHTTAATKLLISSSMQDSPRLNGDLGLSFRYCSSLEEKIDRFNSVEAHQCILEPEGLKTTEFYMKGMGLSLPVDIQIQAMRTVPGLENARLTRPGYTVSYLCFDPRNLSSHLETKIPGLFFAGQINGTTGYEEAAAQGIMAGINAALKSRNERLFDLQRHQSYIGVLIDDITVKGVQEPYRMFTSRAEHRLILREDNAVVRLSMTAIDLGLIKGEEKQKVITKIERIEELIHFLKNTKATRDFCVRNNVEEETGTMLYNLLSKQKLDDNSLFYKEGRKDSMSIIDYIRIQAKYDPHIIIHNNRWEKALAMDAVEIPEDFCYEKINGLSTEALSKLIAVNPRTLGEASRMEGITPAVVSVLAICLKSLGNEPLKERCLQKKWRLSHF